MITMGMTDSENPKIGTWPAWCVSLVDLGTQTTVWAGETKTAHKIALGFELPTQLHKEEPNKGEPMRIQSTVSATMGAKSTLRKLITGHRGEVFPGDAEAFAWAGKTLHKIVGRQTDVVLALSDDGKYVNVVALSPNKATLPKRKSALVYFSLNPNLWTVKTAAQLSHLSADERDVVMEISKAYGAMSEVFGRLPEKTRAKIALSREYRELVSGGGGEDSQPDAHESDIIDPAEDEVPF